MTTAEMALQLTGLFEAELLLELMLRHWGHPLAGDVNFRSDLLECAANILSESIQGEIFIETVPPSEMNFVAAIWYAETVSLAQNSRHQEIELEGRLKWTDSIRHSIPSCFCKQDDLA